MAAKKKSSKKKKRQFQIVAVDERGGIIALDNGWRYPNDVLVAWLSGARDEVRELSAAAPYYLEVVGRDGALVCLGDDADPRPVGLHCLPAIPDWIKLSSGDPSSDRPRS